MEVVYDLSPNSLAEFHCRVLRKNPAVRVAFIIWWFGLPIVCAASIAFLVTMDTIWSIALAAFLVLFGVVWLVMYPLSFWKDLEESQRAAIRRMDTRGIVGTHTLVLTEDSLTEITALTRTERWDEVLRVDADKEMTLIYVTESIIVIMPRRGFPWDEQYEQARDVILARWLRCTEESDLRDENGRA